MKRLLLVGFFIALAFAPLGLSGASSAGPTFRTAQRYPTAAGPNTIAVGDLNGDGKPDVVTSNENDSTIAVLLNRGGGRLGAPRRYDAGEIPYGVAIHDLNGDRKPDAVVADFVSSGSVLVFLNKGGGALADPAVYPAGGSPVSVAFGDLNDDGHPDLVASNTESRNVSVFINNGDGTFQPRINYSAGEDPHTVQVGDVNGDGRPDIVVSSCTPAKIAVLLNKGDGTLGARQEYSAATQCAFHMAMGDLNGDGKPDLVTANLFSRYGATVLLNRGKGVFRASGNYLALRGAQWVAIGDLTGDGKPDLAFATGFTNAVSVLVNRGGGRFLPQLAYPTGPGSAQPVAAGIGDLNGDHRLDIAAANYTNSTVSVLLNKPGVCNVQPVTLMTVAVAEQALVRANCRVGTIRHAYSKKVKAGLVMSQSPGFGLVGPRGGRVNLVVSLGRR
jgi:FG-GAP-like repeat/PASTA domain